MYTFKENETYANDARTLEAVILGIMPGGKLVAALLINGQITLGVETRENLENGFKEKGMYSKGESLSIARIVAEKALDVMMGGNFGIEGISSKEMAYLVAIVTQKVNPNINGSTTP